MMVNRSRKFVLSLLSVIEKIIKEGDMGIQEALGNSIDHIFKVLVFFMRENEVQTLLGLLVNNLNSIEPSIRRSTAKSIIAICRHFPKLEIDYLLSIIDDKYLNQLYSLVCFFILLIYFSFLIIN